jgi:hypothetical protein
MKNVLKFDQFINENWDFPGYGIAINGNGITPNDPSLSVNAYDKFKANAESQVSRLRYILQGIFSDKAVLDKSKFDFKIENLKIFRVLPNNNGFLDVHIKFMLNEQNYGGCFKDWGGKNCSFNSSVLNIPQIRYHLENKIKLEGILKKCLNEWFIPFNGEYKTLTKVKVYDLMGNIFYIPENCMIEVDEVVTEDEQPVINILHNDKMYYITNLDYYFFNWWFEQKEKPKFYI